MSASFFNLVIPAPLISLVIPAPLISLVIPAPEPESPETKCHTNEIPDQVRDDDGL